MRFFFYLSIFILGTTVVRAESINAPRIQGEDSWSYQNTTEDKSGWHQTRVETTVVRAGPATVLLSTKQVGSTSAPSEQLTNADWSRARSVNGHETIVNRPLAFPLSVGKTWTVEYNEDNPNRLHSHEHLKHVYRVTGWEDVTVPAGTFHTLKIESDGEWTATLAPAVSAAAGSRVDAFGSTTVVQTGKTLPATAAGRTYKAFWYAPAVKKWVKSVEEYYDANGARNQRFTADLLSFRTGN